MDVVCAALVQRPVGRIGAVLSGPLDVIALMRGAPTIRRQRVDFPRGGCYDSGLWKPVML